MTLYTECRLDAIRRAVIQELGIDAYEKMLPSINAYFKRGTRVWTGLGRPINYGIMSMQRLRAPGTAGPLLDFYDQNRSAFIKALAIPDVL